MDRTPTPPPIPPATNFLDMNELITHLFTKIENLESDVRACHRQHIEAEQFKNGALVKALERNTVALENINKRLSTLPIKRIKK